MIHTQSTSISQSHTSYHPSNPDSPTPSQTGYTESLPNPSLALEYHLQLVKQEFHIPKTFHILKRNVLPNVFAKKYLDHDKATEWFKNLIDSNNVPDMDHFIWEDIQHYSDKDYKICVYLRDYGLTLYYEYFTESYTICYDRGSSMDKFEEIKSELSKLKAKKEKARIGFIQNLRGSIEVSFHKFKKYDNDLILAMNEEVVSFREKTLEMLKSEDESGLFLLHGEPGTGKTSFIKSVIGELTTDVIYLTPGYAESLTSPELLSLLMDYPGSILVIEDAESVIMQRQADNSNAVSNLLNLTDGFPADYLKLKIICTFNTDLENIDSALLREGRLKGIQEFKPLTADEIERVSKLLGRDIESDKPLSLAKVCNQSLGLKKKTAAIGF